MDTRIHPMRRAVSIVAFIVALILLTGTPGKVREVVINNDVSSNGEYQVASQ